MGSGQCQANYRFSKEEMGRALGCGGGIAADHALARSQRPATSVRVRALWRWASLEGPQQKDEKREARRKHTFSDEVEHCGRSECDDHDKQRLVLREHSRPGCPKHTTDCRVGRKSSAVHGGARLRSGSVKLPATTHPYKRLIGKKILSRKGEGKPSNPLHNQGHA